MSLPTQKELAYFKTHVKTIWEGVHVLDKSDGIEQLWEQDPRLAFCNLAMWTPLIFGEEEPIPELDKLFTEIDLL